MKILESKGATVYNLKEILLSSDIAQLREFAKSSLTYNLAYAHGRVDKNLETSTQEEYKSTVMKSLSAEVLVDII